ncbi:MAG: hypothetical protein GY719_29540 [bacterium]|nr:hypothetical protein [bacterium]
MKNRLILLSLAILLLQAPLYAGVVYEIEVKDHEQSPPKTESIQAAVEGRHLKMGIASGGKGKQGEMIFRGDRREMVVVDHENRTYHKIDEATIGQIAGQLSEAERMMADALKNVPEDKRAMMEQMMKQKMPPGAQAAPQRPKNELKKTSERADRNGYPCVKYEVQRDGRKVRELWVTDWSNVEGGSDVVDAFEDMADFFSEMMDSIPSFGGQGPGGDPAFEHMKEIGGFPVVTREFDDDGSLEGETFLRSSKRQTIDPDAFEPPSGYKRQEMFRPE